MAKQAIPLYDRVLIRRDDGAEGSGGCIIIPDGFKEKPQQGTVIAVGEGRLHTDGLITKLSVQIGDTVLFGKYAGQDVTIDGKEVTILREEEILVKMVETKESVQ